MFIGIVDFIHSLKINLKMKWWYLQTLWEELKDEARLG